MEGLLAHEHDLALGISTVTAEPVELVFFLVGIEKNVPSCEQEQFARLIGINEEHPAGPLDVRRLLVTDRDTERSRERFTNDGDGVGGDSGSVYARE